MTSSVAVANALGAEKLTKVASNVALDSNPVWSPDGKEILFSRENGLYKVCSDGTGEKQLTSTMGKNFTSGYAWSPDGSKISYIENRYDDAMGPRSDLWIMNSDGTGKNNCLILFGTDIIIYIPGFLQVQKYSTLRFMKRLVVPIGK